VEPAAPDPDATAPAASDGSAVGPSEPAGGADSQSGGGAGDGAGGDGGGGVIDLSSRPVPLEIKTSQTLPYTAEAQRDRVSGDVQLLLTVDPLGHVERTTLRHGLGHGLDEIATRLATQIRFRPARDRAGKPTAGTVRWKFHFQPP
jgi:TonB family protein